jgi:hypothetical protein
MSTIVDAWLVRPLCELEILNAGSIKDETGDVLVRIARESDRADLANKDVSGCRAKGVRFVL